MVDDRKQRTDDSVKRMSQGEGDTAIKQNDSNANNGNNDINKQPFFYRIIILARAK